ncbi:MAG: hypothetical protein IB618_01235 [Candidatus Pacearchaeota archaeon]|nr:MAG: hypothetical protein IB618_01235 [Candidatus Pacearchaeota archaeon]
MEFKIEKQEAKPLVGRDEITLKITKIEATPSNAQVQEAIAKLLNKDKALIVIKKIHQKYGMHEAIVSAYAYKSEEDFKKFEVKKKKEKAEEKKEEKPAEEEKPKEEAK